MRVWKSVYARVCMCVCQCLYGRERGGRAVDIIRVDKIEATSPSFPLSFILFFFSNCFFYLFCARKQKRISNAFITFLVINVTFLRIVITFKMNSVIKKRRKKLYKKNLSCEYVCSAQVIHISI